MGSLNELEKELNLYADKERAILSQRYFKTGKGEYGEGDIFLGINNPMQRKIAKKFKDLLLEDLQVLLNSKIHEKRQIALFVLLEKFRKADQNLKKQIFEFYLSNTKNINNWDLVDLSAPNIVGNWLIDKDRSILYKLVKSKDLWEKRISIISTFSFIRKEEFADSIKIAEILLKDKPDLIHKAVGWMLREVGKRDQKELESFLNKHCKEMPRTMLRYAIEKLPKDQRELYMKK